MVNSQKKRGKKKNQELQTSERVDLEHFKVYKCVAVLRDPIPCDHFLGCQYSNFSDTGEKQNKQKSQSSDRLGCLKYIFNYLLWGVVVKNGFRDFYFLIQGLEPHCNCSG